MSRGEGGEKKTLSCCCYCCCCCWIRRWLLAQEEFTISASRRFVTGALLGDWLSLLLTESTGPGTTGYHRDSEEFLQLMGVTRGGPRAHSDLAPGPPAQRTATHAELCPLTLQGGTSVGMRVFVTRACRSICFAHL